MGDKLVILLVEDDPESANDFKEDAEALIDVEVVTTSPPVNLLDLPMLINEHHADAVILDERLQQHSDATYLGTDAFYYLRETFPTLPIDILTVYPPSLELKGRGFSVENWVRKRDLDDDEEYKETYLQGLYQRMIHYHEHREHIASARYLQPAPDAVTEEFVESLANLHFETEESIEQIIWVRSGDEKEIRLIEVNRTALPTESFQMFRFAPSEDVPFPMLIADVTPREWEQIKSGDIPLPADWDLGSIQVFQRS